MHSCLPLVAKGQRSIYVICPHEMRLWCVLIVLQICWGTLGESWRQASQSVPYALPYCVLAH